MMIQIYYKAVSLIYLSYPWNYKFINEYSLLICLRTIKNP